MKETLWENNLKFVKDVCIIQLLIIVPKKKKKNMRHHFHTTNCI